MHKPLLKTLALVAVPALLVSANADAAGFSTARFGGEHGNPMTSNPTAIYYNPAGITGSEGYHIFLDGNFAFRGVSYTHSEAPSDVPESDYPGAQGANNGQATLFNVAAAPMLGATAKFGDFAVGLGFYVPFGGSATWSKNDAFENNTQYPGAVDGQQRWYTITGELRSLYFTLAAAYEIPGTGLSVGVSGNLISSKINTIRARDADGSNDLGPEGRALVDVSGLQGSFGVGLLYEPMPDELRFGLSYQSRPNISGGMTLSGELRGANSIPSADIDISQDLPDIFRLGASFRPRTDLELRLFGDFTRWSSLVRHCLVEAGVECKIAEDGSGPPNNLQNQPRDWNDTFGVRAGASLWLTPEIEGFAGLGYDGNAVPDETLEPSLVDFHDVSTALGARMAFGEHFHAALSYTHFFYISRNNAGESKLSEYKAPSTGPDAGGSYSQWVGVINANVEANF